jgi:hypothetical protein
MDLDFNPTGVIPAQAGIQYLHIKETFKYFLLQN